MNYTLNQDLAIKGGSLSSSRLAEGLHIVKITQAYKFTSSGGAVGIHFDIQDKDEKSGNIELYTVKKDGTKNDMGVNQVNAIMFITGTQTMNESPGNIIYYDFQAKQDAQKQAPVYPEIMGKYMAVIFKKDTYLNSQGEIKAKFEMVAPLNHKTNQTVYEMVNQLEAKEYEGMLKYALSESDKATSLIESQPVTQTHQATGANGHSEQDDFDDIPF